MVTTFRNNLDAYLTLMPDVCYMLCNPMQIRKIIFNLDLFSLMESPTSSGVYTKKYKWSANIFLCDKILNRSKSNTANTQEK